MSHDVSYEYAKIFATTKVLQYTTPSECLKKSVPKAHITADLPLMIFDYTAYVHIPKTSRSTLDPTAEKSVFVGYAPNKKGYMFLNPLPKKFYVAVNAAFLENVPFCH